MFIKKNKFNLFFISGLMTVNFFAVAAEKKEHVRYGHYKIINPYEGTEPQLVKSCVSCSKCELELGHSLLKCGGTCEGKNTWYCSKKCQLADWPDHKEYDKCCEKRDASK